jgi:hypothetical protein
MTGKAPIIANTKFNQGDGETLTGTAMFLPMRQTAP